MLLAGRPALPRLLVGLNLLNGRRPQRRAPAATPTAAGRLRPRGLVRRPDPAAVPDRRARRPGCGAGRVASGCVGAGWVLVRSCCSSPPSSAGRCTSPLPARRAARPAACSPPPGARRAPLARAPVAALLLARAARERAPGRAPPARAVRRPVVRTLADAAAGEPIVAADQRSAIGLDHYVRTCAPSCRPDRRPPPDDTRTTPTGSGSSASSSTRYRPPTTTRSCAAAGLRIDRRRYFPPTRPGWCCRVGTLSYLGRAPASAPRTAAQSCAPAGASRSCPSTDPALGRRPGQRSRSSTGRPARATARTTLGAPLVATAAITAAPRTSGPSPKAPASAGSPVSRAASQPCAVPGSRRSPDWSAPRRPAKTAATSPRPADRAAATPPRAGPADRRRQSPHDGVLLGARTVREGERAGRR